MTNSKKTTKKKKTSKIPFTQDDFNSGDGMMTSIWGPPMWHILHTISFNYPVNPTCDQKKYYYKFYKNLVNILPCKYCRDNLANNLSKHPLTKEVFASRDSLSRWVYQLHEIVNKMLGKKSNLTFEDVRNRYEHFRSRCLKTPKEIKEEAKKMKLNGEKEKGCVEPLYGVKSKCVLNIVPKEDKKNKDSFIMDPKCKIKKLKL